MMKKCSICQCAIDTTLDDYSKIESFSGKKELSKKWYHTKCYMERILTKNEEMKTVKASQLILKRLASRMQEVGM